LSWFESHHHQLVVVAWMYCAVAIAAVAVYWLVAVVIAVMVVA